MNLVIANCSFEASKFAVMNWHYSKAMPSGKLVKYGVWENDEFVGSVIYGRGATPRLGTSYGLDQTEVCELVRVALKNGHKAPTSQIVAQTIKMIKSENPGLQLIVSFADSAQNHHGGIYQAMNWIYCGESLAHRFKINGELMHPRSVGAKYGYGGQSIPWLKKNVDANAEKVMVPGKHRYLYPLNKQMRRKIAKLAEPYPRAVEGLEASRNNSVVEV